MPDSHENKPHYGAAKETLDRTVDWSQKGCGGGMVVGLILALIVSAIAFPPLLLVLLPIGAGIAYLLLRKPRQANTEQTSEVAEQPLATLDFGMSYSVHLYSDRLSLMKGALNPRPIKHLPLPEADMEIEPKAVGNAAFTIFDSEGEVLASHDAVRLAKAERFLSQLHAAQSSAEDADRA